MNSQALYKVVAEALEIDAEKINADTKSEDISEWDSLGQLAILTAVDEAFPNEMSNLDGLGAVTSVKALADILLGAGLLKD